VATAKEDGHGKPQGRETMRDSQQRHWQGQGHGPEARDLNPPRERAKKGEGGRGGKGTRLGGDSEEDGGRGVGKTCVLSAVVDGRVDWIVDLIEYRGVEGRIKRRGGGTERRKSDGTTISQGEARGRRVATGVDRSQWSDGTRDRRAAAYGGCGRDSTIEVYTKNQN